MKFTLSLILFVALLPVLSANVFAENTSDAAQNVAALRAQLANVQARENELQARARQLDDDLKPENIERSLAGVGSTRPEELREQRRRQLTIERDGVRAQLNLLATSRERLESAIRRAEGIAYQESAAGVTPALDQMFATHYSGNHPWLIGGAMAVIVVLGITLVSAGLRRLL